MKHRIPRGNRCIKHAGNQVKKTGVPELAEASRTLSDKGDILSPIMAPAMMAPAASGRGIPHTGGYTDERDFP